MSGEVVDQDKGYAALLKALGALDSASVLVGVRGGQTDEDGTDLAQIAAWNEFGTDRIPERSFLRSTLKAKQQDYEKMLGQAAEAALRGRAPLRQGLGRIGAKAVSDVQAAIRAGIDPPNAASTVAKKGSSKPLIDTGRLIQSIEYEVEG